MKRSSEAIVSGELYYRSGYADKALATSTSAEFRDFLASDSNSDVQAEKFSYQLESLKKLEGLATSNFRHAAALEKALCTNGIESLVKSYVSTMKCSQNRILAAMERLQTSHDASMMQLTLQYFDILKGALEENRKSLYAAAKEAELLKSQAKVLHDIDLFALYLHYETKRKISLQILEGDSSQFRRCKKAIKDSVGPNLSKMGYRDTKVLAVLKLEHTLISNQLQRSAGSIDEGKVKGLFCVIPKGGLYSFISFGMHAQTSLSSNSEGSISSSGKRSVAMKNIDEGLPNLFQVSWIWAECEDNESLEGDLTGGRGAHYAEKLARDSAKVIHSYVNTNIEKGVPRNSRQGYDETRDCSFLKFSRCSTPSGVETLPRDHMEEGCFIALCRVLISKSRSVAGPISDRDAKEATDMGYDCVYSKASEEYILLKPRYVLPEFVMHVQMIPSNKEHNAPTPRRKERVLSKNTAREGDNTFVLDLEEEEETWLPDCLTSSSSTSLHSHADSEGGSMRYKSQSGIIQANLSTSIKCQNVGEVLSGNEMRSSLHRHVMNVNAEQGNVSANFNSDVDEGDENVLGDDESLSALKTSSSRESTVRKQAILNAIRNSTHEFTDSVRDLYRREFYREDEEVDSHIQKDEE